MLHGTGLVCAWQGCSLSAHEGTGVQAFLQRPLDDWWRPPRSQRRLALTATSSTAVAADAALAGRRQLRRVRSRLLLAASRALDEGGAGGANGEASEPGALGCTFKHLPP